MSLNANFKAIFEQSPNAYLLLTPDLVIADANAAYLRATVSRLEDIVGRYVFDAFPHDPDNPDNAPASQLKASLARVLKTGLPDYIALVHYRVPGQTEHGVSLTDHYWSSTNTPIFDEDTKEIAFILHHAVDVTELHRLRLQGGKAGKKQGIGVEARVFDRARQIQETNLQLVEERLLLHNLLEQTPGFVAYLKGPEHIFGMTNAAYRKFVGRSDLIGKAVKDALPELVEQGFIDLLDQVYATGEPFIAKAAKALLQRRPDADIETVFVDFIFQPVIDTDGAVTGIFVQGHDVTEWKNAEEDLQLWKQAIEAASNGIMITDYGKADNPIVYVNPSFERITGYSSEEVVGKNARFLQGNDTDQRALAGIRDALREGRREQAVLRNYRKDGELFWNELSIAPVDNASGPIRYFIGIQKDVTQRKHFEAQLEYQVNHDALTGLPNRNLVRDRLQQAIAHAQRDNRLVGVFFLDLDRFKVVNDSMGHDAGDELLCEVAKKLAAAFRAGDTVSRLGGDEFVVIAHQLNAEQEAIELARRALAAIAHPVRVANRELNVTCSIGIALFPRSGSTVPELLKHADTSMYQAKRAGRNTFSFYAPEMNALARLRFELEAGMRHAITRKEFILHYQPQIDLRSGDIAGFEALVRWQHPTLGLLLPGKFIDLAEETGLIVEIGEWALREACRQAGQWQVQGLGKHSVAVNLSARQFTHSDLLHLVDDALADAALDAHCLKLEITESLLMENPQAVAEMLSRLRQRGVQLAVDDFGTGYSSLGYLKRFALDELKIDRAFVRDLATNPDDAAIATTIIALAHQLKLKVTAEGVETADQLHILKEHRCDRVQGYFFSKPLSPSDCTQFLKGFRRFSLPGETGDPAA